MNFLKIKLLVIAIIMFAASSAFASLSYEVTVDTSSLNGQSGYLYLQYNPFNGASSTATIANFATDGILGAQDTADVVNGSAVSGMLAGPVTFNNTNGVNDYLHAITFGNSLSFLAYFSNLASGGQQGGASTFSLGVFGVDTVTPLLNTNGGNYAGTVAMINLFNDGTTNALSLDSTTTATATPIPAAAWLLGSGLIGLAGIRRRKG
ncbi:MAG TPA: NF038129 family PEP-CTERM protein [Geobacteraceae bacterium]|nr:NF038129 family PEP-CTERM protein [Geobacteraceae bacterium]